MISRHRELVDRYLDDTLSPDEHEELSGWIQSDPKHARMFAQAALMHDWIRNILEGADGELSSEPSAESMRSRRWPGSTWLFSSLGRTVAAVAIFAAGLGLLWFSLNVPTAAAAMRELDRIIVHSRWQKDRTYRIVVEDMATERRGKRSPHREVDRPPKPPLDEAILHVREGNQFVLIRKTQDGVPFTTGCNGEQSWAINTRGPVRVSSDVHRFDRDLPGHETSVPLTNLHEGLQQLRQAYEVSFSPLGPEEILVEGSQAPRLLVAVKKPLMRGPQRVEIVYESTTGRILRMRFVQMPYGPDRLDVRLTLLNEDALPEDFFEHSSHHTADRRIEFEN